MLPETFLRSIDAFSEPFDCHGVALAWAGGIAVIGVLLVFCGHQMIDKALCALAGLVAFGLQAALGTAWLAHTGRDDFSQKIVVLGSCFVWALLAGLLTWRQRRTVQQALAFLLGAAAAGGGMVYLLYVLRTQLAAAGAGAQFAARNAAVALALLVGYAAAISQQAKYLFMLVTNLLGTVMTLVGVDALLSCTNFYSIMSKSFLQDLLVVLLLCSGLAVQFAFRPRPPKKQRQIHAEAGQP
ncbi:unnamed protein product [Effrenium voratum]|uniref:Uncharacterized protein n=1 Tax=Effrenium voratum TaxID=2562239 RepID=A0AA36HLC2_9DINO|nr:unnamed protein product [Effrenium voratum]CAJ1459699.1 unnamed protein product [Effrenium voratum]